MPPSARSSSRGRAGGPRAASRPRGTAPPREPIPATLYKHVPPERVDILENACVRFTQPHVFNDAFEMSPVWTGLSDVETFAALAPEPFAELRKYRNNRQIAEVLAGVNQAMVDQGTLAELRHVFLSSLHRGTGVLSLAETPDNLLMWSHYADQHRGFLVAFDARHAFFDQRRSADDEFHHVRKVRYAADRPTGNAFGLSGPHLLLTKSAEWQCWCNSTGFPHRVVAQDDQDVCLVSLPRSCITAVILGCRMQRETVDAIADVLEKDRRYKHVSVSQASLHPEKFGLVFRSLGDHYLERGKELVARALLIKSADWLTTNSSRNSGLPKLQSPISTARSAGLRVPTPIWPAAMPTRCWTSKRPRQPISKKRGSGIRRFSFACCNRIPI